MKFENKFEVVQIKAGAGEIKFDASNSNLMLSSNI